MDDLTKAIISAGCELAEKHEWSFDGTLGLPPTEDNPFVEVVRKHILPMTNIETWKQSRIHALRAELSQLEQS